MRLRGSVLQTDWAEYFRNYKQSLAEAPAVEDEPKELLEPMTPVLPGALPRGPKTLRTRLEQAQWEVFTERSRVRVGRTYYKSTDRVGEVKVEAHEVVHWQLRARLVRGGRIIAATLVSWEQKKSCTFQDAFIWSIVTRERELVSTMKELEEWLSILAPKQQVA